MEALINLAKDFFNTDWELIEFSDTRTAVWLGIVFLLLVLVKVFLFPVLAKAVFGRNRTSRAGSGHFISKSLQQGWFSRLVHLAPKLIVAGGVFFILFAFADPFSLKSFDRETIDSRERIEILDVSASMGYEYNARSNESLAEMVRRLHLGFLEMRRGMNDRVALWLFTNEPHKAADFIQDDDVYRMQVRNAPWVIITKRHGVKKEKEFIVPEEKIYYADGAGGTNLVDALRASLYYLDQESDIRIQRKTILLITDAAANVYPENELREIKRRGIVLYILFIKPAPRLFEQAKTNRTIRKQLENSKKFIEQVRFYGGKYYEADDEESIAKIFEEINELESVQMQRKRHSTKVHIYAQPLSIGVILLALGLLIALLLEVFRPERP